MKELYQVWRVFEILTENSAMDMRALVNPEHMQSNAGSDL